MIIGVKSKRVVDVKITRYINEKSLKQNTQKRYAQNSNEWDKYIQSTLFKDDIYLDTADRFNRREVMSTFVIYLEQTRKLSPSQITAILSALRHRFVCNLRDDDVFKDESVLLARKATMGITGREKSIQAEERKQFPITIDMIKMSRKINWEQADDIDKKMTYIGVAFGFNFMNRVSELVLDGVCNEYAVMSQDTLLLLTNEKRVSPWQLQKIRTQDVLTAHFVVYASKKGQKARHLYLTRKTEEESQLLSDMVEFMRTAGIKRDEPLLSRYKNGRFKKLTRKMINEEIKEMARRSGLNEIEKGFTTRSMRIGGCTTMKAAGESSRTVKLVGGWAAESTCDSIYDRNTPMEGGALSACTSRNKLLTSSDVKKLIPPNQSRSKNPPLKRAGQIEGRRN